MRPLLLLVLQARSRLDGDNAQDAIEPFLSYDPPNAFFRLGVLTAVDAPLGPGFDEGNAATMRLMVGSHFV